MNTKRRGDVSELKIAAKFSEMGYGVYAPYGENTRSDLIIEKNGELVRVQVKTAWESNNNGGCVKFNTASTRSNYTEVEEKSYSKENIDGFAVYSPDEDEYYWVDVEEAPKTSMYIRVDEPQRNQWKNINWHKDFFLTERFK